MKRISIVAIAMVAFLSTINAQEPDVVVGTNLNIGIDNTIIPNTNCGNAIGMYNQVNGNNSICVGYGNSTSLYSPCSAVFGSHNHLGGMGGFIAGYANTTASSLGMALGENLKVTGTNSILFGRGLGQEEMNLENSMNSAFMVGYNSIKPTFIVYGPRNVGDIVDMTGKIAIGDVTDGELRTLDAKLIIRSDVGEEAGIILEPKQPETNSAFIRMRDESHCIKVWPDGEMSINSGDANNLLPLTLLGKVGINIENNFSNYAYALAVDGGILTDKVLIRNVDEWHDAVFSDDYKLMPLNELKDYVTTHHHLPDVPSESEVMEEGYDMGEMQGLLLKKIEELTLYTIQLKELVERQQKEIDELKAK